MSFVFQINVAKILSILIQQNKSYFYVNHREL